MAVAVVAGTALAFTAAAWRCWGLRSIRFAQATDESDRRKWRAGPLRDAELLLTAARFLALRTGTDVDGEHGVVFAATVEAYGLRGADRVRRLLEEHQDIWPRTILSIRACELTASVYIAYPGAEMETLHFAASHDGCSALIVRVDCSRSDGSPCSLRPNKRSARAHWRSGHGLVFNQLPTKEAPRQNTASAATRWTGVECLWWAVRFLHADLTRDYARQRRYLAHDAAAFGARGRNAILEANGEQLPDDQKTGYSVPYPLCVDAKNGTVVLMFDAFDSSGHHLYHGTDIMFVKSGLVQRITTINHDQKKCWSPPGAH